MPINVPDNPKVYTTKYDNFKGVDFTNDATNVWRRRSPTGVNMLPDESGRPFKRHGWDILISNERLCEILEVSKVTIEKLSYFELAGVDHIVIFTNEGVIFYGDGVTDISKDSDCYGSYDRCFFFEGNGKAAFYIYGNYRIWRYDETFTLQEVTDDATIPTVLISSSADLVGTVYDAYNLIGQRASVEYNGVELFSYWGSDGIGLVMLDEAGLKTAMSSLTYAHWIYDEDTEAWIGVNNSITLTTYISTIGELKDKMSVVVVSCYGVMLPNNVSQDQINNVQVNASGNSQFDTPIEVLSVGNTPSTGQCVLYTDPASVRSWIEFNATDAQGWKASWEANGVDYIKTVFPVGTITITNYPIDPSTPVQDISNATLDGEVV